MDSTGIKKGIPRPGENNHALILSDPILKLIAAYRAIGKSPARIKRCILSPENFRKNRNTYNVAKMKNRIWNLLPREGIFIPKFTNARKRRRKLNKFLSSCDFSI